MTHALRDRGTAARDAIVKCLQAGPLHTREIKAAIEHMGIKLQSSVVTYHLNCLVEQGVVKQKGVYNKEFLIADAPPAPVKHSLKRFDNAMDWGVYNILMQHG